MKITDALVALGALAHETRLATFRLLVSAGHGGLPAGEIAGRLGVAPPVMSFHLAELARAGLVESRREGRSIIYVAGYKRIGALLDYLIEDCCQGACGTRGGALTKEKAHEAVAR
jgi:DNA-binding transcriptional ArsR family regulator